MLLQAEPHIARALSRTAEAAIPAFAIRRANLDGFFRGSLVDVPTFHETRRAAHVDSIRSTGVDVSRSYKSATLRAFFASAPGQDAWYGGGLVVEAAIQSRRPYVVHNLQFTRTIDRAIDADPVAREAARNRPPSVSRSEWLLGQGYDSVVQLKDGEPVWVAGLRNDTIRVVVD